MYKYDPLKLINNKLNNCNAKHDHIIEKEGVLSSKTQVNLITTVKY